MWVATWEAKLPSPVNSSGFSVATTMASGRSRPASASAARAASAMSPGSGSLRRPIRVIAAPATLTRCTATIIHRNGAFSSAALAPPAGWRRGRRHAELADEPQQVCPLEPEGPGGVRAVAAHLVERGLDQPALEVRDGAVIADRAREQRRGGGGRRGHG